MDRALTFHFFDVLCINQSEKAIWVSRAEDPRAAIVFRLRELRCDVRALAELPARCYWLSEEQFIAMLVLNDTASL